MNKLEWRVDLTDYRIKVTDNLEMGLLAQVNTIKYITGYSEFKHKFYRKYGG